MLERHDGYQIPAWRTNHIKPTRGYVVTPKGFFNMVRNISPGNKKILIILFTPESIICA